MTIQTVQPERFADIDWSGVSKRFFNPGELEVLVALIEDIGAKIVIEVGVNEGRNPKVLLARDNAIERYFGIDVPPTYRPSLQAQRGEVPARPGHMAADDPRFELVLRPQGSLELGPDDLPEADVMFIDGDHSWKAVLHDSMLARRVVRKGGLIIWHDYHDLGVVDVKPVLDSLQIGFDGTEEEIRHIAGTWFCFQVVA